MMMTKMTMELFCGIVDRRNTLSLVYNRDHCQRFSPLEISDTSPAVFEPVQNT